MKLPFFVIAKDSKSHHDDAVRMVEGRVFDTITDAVEEFLRLRGNYHSVRLGAVGSDQLLFFSEKLSEEV